jgi:hypothetical protein
VLDPQDDVVWPAGEQPQTPPSQSLLQQSLGTSQAEAIDWQHERATTPAHSPPAQHSVELPHCFPAERQPQLPWMQLPLQHTVVALQGAELGVQQFRPSSATVAVHSRPGQQSVDAVQGLMGAAQAQRPVDSQVPLQQPRLLGPQASPMPMQQIPSTPQANPGQQSASVLQMPPGEAHWHVPLQLPWQQFVSVQAAPKAMQGPPVLPPVSAPVAPPLPVEPLTPPAEDPEAPAEVALAGPAVPPLPCCPPSRTSPLELEQAGSAERAPATATKRNPAWSLAFFMKQSCPPIIAHRES